MQNCEVDIITTHDDDLDIKRSQFNFTSGNYSDEPKEVVNYYIKKFRI